MPEAALLTLERVHHRYVQAFGPLGLGRREVSTLSGIDLELRPGDWRAVVGPSGAGKSTLLSIMAGLTAPSAGRVVWHGMTGALGPRQRVLLFQSAAASFDPLLSIEANLLEPLLMHRVPDPRSVIRRSLEEVGLSEQILPWPTTRLSGGEAQRLALARALSLEPKLLLADEPTASLDLVGRAELVELLLRLRTQRKLALVLVTHDLALAMALVDEIAVLSQGKLVERRAAHDFAALAQHEVSRALLSIEGPGFLPSRGSGA